MSKDRAGDALLIRPATGADWPGIWAVLEPVIREGESYPLDRELGEEAARAYWFAADKSVFVAQDPTGEIVGALPGAFRRPNGDYVDALVMYRSLVED